MENPAIHHQDIDKIRKRFKEYLSETHPNWSPSTVSMNYSDSFIVYNNNLVSNFWECFVNDDTMTKARDKIFEYLKKDKQSPRAKERDMKLCTKMN